MAQGAIAGIYTHVVKYHAGKGYGVMASAAILIIGIGRNVVLQLTHTDHVIVARITAITDTEMAIGARAKSTRGMAHLAIIATDWHVLID